MWLKKADEKRNTADPDQTAPVGSTVFVEDCQVQIFNTVLESSQWNNSLQNELYYHSFTYLFTDFDKLNICSFIYSFILIYFIIFFFFFFWENSEK